jgi:hypothetical protein
MSKLTSNREVADIVIGKAVVGDGIVTPLAENENVNTALAHKD